MSDETTSNAAYTPAVTDEQIDAIDDKFVLHWMAPRGRESVRGFARELLALATPKGYVDESIAVSRLAYVLTKHAGFSVRDSLIEARKRLGATGAHHV